MHDSGQFGEFYAATAPRMVAQMYAMIGDLSEAEDAVQEAYARAWSRWRRVGAYADPVGWVLSVQEIAEETGSSRSAVKAQLSRGRQALAPLLSMEGRTEAHARD